MSHSDGESASESCNEHTVTCTNGVIRMGGLAPPVGGWPTETITLTCGHRLANCTVNQPLVLPGSSIRCPTCTIPRTILRVKSSPAVSGRLSWAHAETAHRHKILVFDDADGF